MGPGEGLGEGAGRLRVSGGENLRLFLTAGSCMGRMWMAQPLSSLGSRMVTSGFHCPSPSPVLWYLPEAP